MEPNDIAVNVYKIYFDTAIEGVYYKKYSIIYSYDTEVQPRGSFTFNLDFRTLKNKHCFCKFYFG